MLTHLDWLSAFYTLLPLFGAHAKAFTFVQDHRWCLKDDRNKDLLIVRYFERDKPGPDTIDAQLLMRLADRYDRLVWFDDSDGVGTSHFEVLPYVTRYYRKQLFRDRELHRRSFYGRELFTEHYHREHGIRDEQDQRRRPFPDDQDLDKLALAWNLGVGTYPSIENAQRVALRLARHGSTRALVPFEWRRRRQAFGVAPTPRRPVVQARYSLVPRPTIAFQRERLLALVSNRPDVLSGRVGARQFNAEMRQVASVLCPFGWGEVTFRDFECILHGAVMIKPDMDHLDTFPNVYRNGETYAAIDWDLGDVHECLDALVGDPAECARLAANASDAWRTDTQRLDRRVEALLADFGR